MKGAIARRRCDGVDLKWTALLNPVNRRLTERIETEERLDGRHPPGKGNAAGEGEPESAFG